MDVIEFNSLLMDIQFQLDQFKKVTRDVYNFRCPYCGDSKKDNTKARGFLYPGYQDGYVFSCHNCGKVTNFESFLKDHFRHTYNTFRFRNFHSRKYTDVKLGTDKRLPPKNSTILNCFRRELPDDVKKYLFKRRLLRHQDKFLYSEDIQTEFLQYLDEYKDRKPVPPQRRLIIPFFTKDRKLSYIQYRNLDDDSYIRYGTIKLSDEPKLYGLDRLDTSRLFYVLEGPLDSLFLPNAIAMAGGYGDISYFYPDEQENLVFLLDNEPRNKDVLRFYSKIIDSGMKIVIWNKRYPYKDVNQIFQENENLKISEFLEYLESRTYQGLMARLEFNKFKKL